MRFRKTFAGDFVPLAFIRAGHLPLDSFGGRYDCLDSTKSIVGSMLDQDISEHAKMLECKSGKA